MISIPPKGKVIKNTGFFEGFPASSWDQKWSFPLMELLQVSPSPSPGLEPGGPLLTPVFLLGSKQALLRIIKWNAISSGLIPTALTRAWSWTSGPSPALVFTSLGYSIFCLFFPFRSTPLAYENSQSRSRIEVTAADLCHSHSNARSELHLWLTLQLTAMPDP